MAPCVLVEEVRWSFEAADIAIWSSNVRATTQPGYDLGVQYPDTGAVLVAGVVGHEFNRLRCPCS
jgi:hypothetical protein